MLNTDIDIKYVISNVTQVGMKLPRATCHIILLAMPLCFSISSHLLSLPLISYHTPFHFISDSSHKFTLILPFVIITLRPFFFSHFLTLTDIDLRCNHIAIQQNAVMGGEGSGELSQHLGPRNTRIGRSKNYDQFLSLPTKNWVMKTLLLANNGIRFRSCYTVCMALVVAPRPKKVKQSSLTRIITATFR